MNAKVIVEFQDDKSLLEVLGYKGLKPGDYHENCVEGAMETWGAGYIGLSIHNLVDIGFAYASFCVKELDQGIHALLPGTTEEGMTENTVFYSLFDNYLDKLQKADGPDLGEAYAGGLLKWLRDVHHIELFNEAFIETYDQYTKGH